jgi:hypothetical protein
MRPRKTAIVPQVIFGTAAITGVIPACGGNTESDRGKAGSAGQSSRGGQGGRGGSPGGGGTGAFYVLAIGGYGNQPVDPARGGTAGTGGFIALGAYGFGGSPPDAGPGGSAGDDADAGPGGAAGADGTGGLPDSGLPGVGGFIVLAIDAFRGRRPPGS